MNEEKKMEYLMIRLQRTDDWINFSDTKASIILATIGVLLGLFINDKTIAIFERILNYSTVFIIINFILILLGLVFVFLGLVNILKSLIPNLKNPTNKKSLHYFGNISEMNLNNFIIEVNERTSQEDIDDLLSQIFVNSKICDVKHKYLSKGIKKSFLGLFTLFIIIILNYFVML